jgi:hypothetical protein
VFLFTGVVREARPAKDAVCILVYWYTGTNNYSAISDNSVFESCYSHAAITSLRTVLFCRSDHFLRGTLDETRKADKRKIKENKKDKRIAKKKTMKKQEQKWDK